MFRPASSFKCTNVLFKYECFILTLGAKPTLSPCCCYFFFFGLIGWYVKISSYAGLVGRNGTGKTTFLRHLAMHAIEGTPRNCQILHVEQEVTGDDTTALQCVLNADTERTQLMQEEARLVELQVLFSLF